MVSGKFTDQLACTCMIVTNTAFHVKGASTCNYRNLTVHVRSPIDLQSLGREETYHTPETQNEPMLLDS